MKEQDWNIKAPSTVCHQCKRPFEDGEKFTTRLFFRQGVYDRADVCDACLRPESEPGVLSIWRSIHRAPPPPEEEPLKKETAEQLLRRLIEQENPDYENTIFVLAVMLERRRILNEKEVKQHDDGHLIRVYEHRKTGEAFLISDPRLKLTELESVQAEVIAMLEGARGESETHGQDSNTPENRENTSSAGEIT